MAASLQINVHRPSIDGANWHHSAIQGDVAHVRLGEHPTQVVLYVNDEELDALILRLRRVQEARAEGQGPVEFFD